MIDGNDKKAARIAALTASPTRWPPRVPADPPPVRPEMEQLANRLLKQGRD